jgi:hypothetical protein
MEEMKITAKTLGVVMRGPLAMHATWEMLPIRMLRLLIEIEKAEKTSASSSASMTAKNAARP